MKRALETAQDLPSTTLLAATTCTPVLQAQFSIHCILQRSQNDLQRSRNEGFSAVRSDLSQFRSAIVPQEGRAARNAHSTICHHGGSTTTRWHWLEMRNSEMAVLGVICSKCYNGWCSTDYFFTTATARGSDKNEFIFFTMTNFHQLQESIMNFTEEIQLHRNLGSTASMVIVIPIPRRFGGSAFDQVTICVSVV
jgi:hypothetical protein